MAPRQIVLDTETTGLSARLGDRLIEIGCIEIVNRRVGESHFHRYLNPERDIDLGAERIHGLSREFLADKPLFREIAGEFLDYVRGAQLIIHNAPFDTEFLDRELALVGLGKLSEHCPSVIDTLPLARELHPGKKNTLDALWGDQAFPQEIDDALEAAHRALWRALYCELEELVVTGEGAFEVPDLLLGFQEDLAASHHGTLAAMAPGSLAFPGEPIAWWCERNAPSFTSPRLTRRAAGGPTQVLRFVDASSRFVADRVIALDALAEPLPIDALPMLTPLLLNGARIGVFLHARSEWSAMQHDAMQGRSALTVER